jgi:dolichyl-phosphate beta-glucosyltransferase
MQNQEHSMFLSIILPAYNESRRIESGLKDIQSFLSRLPAPWEVIVVIEKSTDNTVEVARKITAGDSRFKIIASDVQKGKGFAVKTGMLQAQGEFVFFMDVDLSTPLVEVMHFLSELSSDPFLDILIGDRKHKTSQIIKKQWWLRQKMGEVFNLFVQSLTFKGIKDTQCGFKAFRKKTILPLFGHLKTDGFAFDVEVLWLAQKLGYKIKTLPVKWINSKDSKVRIVRDSLKMFFDLILIRLRVAKSLRVIQSASQPLPKSSDRI